MTGKETKSQAETDLERARERLSFYEQFDEIIKQNIISSSALLKEASTRFDNDFTGERRRHRALLSEILDDVTTLQAQSERLARRVSDALDEIENQLPAGADLPLSPAPKLLAAEAPPETAAIVETTRQSTTDQPVQRVEPSPIPSPPDPTPPAPILPNTAPVTELPPTETVSTTLLVHGVPRASAALELKSYIEALDFVTNVEPREFAAGLLRLQIKAARPLAVSDLDGWSMAKQIQIKTASNDMLEFGLSPAN